MFTILISLPAVVCGCGDGDGKNVFTKLWDLQLDYYAFECECLVASGQFASVDACFLANAVSSSLTDEDQCVVDELSKSDPARNYAECSLPIQREYVDCLEVEGCPDTSDFACEDGTTIPRAYVCDGDTDCTGGEDELNCDAVTCTSTRDAQIAACGSVPATVAQSAEFTCYGSFECTDGVLISRRWVCDGWDDCEGGEDEVDCP